MSEQDGAYEPGPTEIHDPRIRFEVQKALVWVGVVLLAAGMIVLAAPLLLIVGGMVFAVLLDGGTRLLGRYLPIARGWRLLIVTLSGFAFLIGSFWYAGRSFAQQFALLRDTVMMQAERVMVWATEQGLIEVGNFESLSAQLFDSIGRVTSVLTSAIGVLTAVVVILVLGIFMAAEPKLYDRGVAWMLPIAVRKRFFKISDRVGYSLRRLLAGRLAGMFVEGVFTYLMLTLGARLIGLDSFPLAPVLALLTGLLAFIPNIGAIVSGMLMVAVGFSVGNQEGYYAIAVYLIVQNVDGYLILPYIARRTVDLAPAVLLAAQLILGTLFGFLGLLLADPIVASIKATLEALSRNDEEDDDGLDEATIEQITG